MERLCLSNLCRGFHGLGLYEYWDLQLFFSISVCDILSSFLEFRLDAYFFNYPSWWDAYLLMVMILWTLNNYSILDLLIRYCFLVDHVWLIMMGEQLWVSFLCIYLFCSQFLDVPLIDFHFFYFRNWKLVRSVLNAVLRNRVLLPGFAIFWGFCCEKSWVVYIILSPYLLL